jgi:hypothetical protein
MTAVPLAMVASDLLQLWGLFIPLCLCAWWYAERKWPWTWLVAVESGAFGTLWAYSGAVALAQFAAHRLLVGAIWVSLAAALAAVSAVNRAENSQSADYPGY